MRKIKVCIIWCDDYQNEKYVLPILDKLCGRLDQEFLNSRCKIGDILYYLPHEGMEELDADCFLLIRDVGDEEPYDDKYFMGMYNNHKKYWGNDISFEDFKKLIRVEIHPDSPLKNLEVFKEIGS